MWGQDRALLLRVSVSSSRVGLSPEAGHPPAPGAGPFLGHVKARTPLPASVLGGGAPGGGAGAARPTVPGSEGVLPGGEATASAGMGSPPSHPVCGNRPVAQMRKSRLARRLAARGQRWPQTQISDPSTCLCGHRGGKVPLKTLKYRKGSLVAAVSRRRLTGG